MGFTRGLSTVDQLTTVAALCARLHRSMRGLAVPWTMDASSFRPHKLATVQTSQVTRFPLELVAHALLLRLARLLLDRWALFDSNAGPK